MTSTEITTSLRNNHASFIHLIGQLNGEQLNRAQPHQWNAAQQLEHIYLSFRPVLLAFQLPRFIPRLLFGVAKRKSRDYDTLVRDYQIKLQQGGKAPSAYVPTKAANTIKRLLELEKSVDRLCHIIDGLTEEEL
ncbi:MAG: DinB family protein, partial [Bacteroidota bacterium]